MMVVVEEVVKTYAHPSPLHHLVLAASFCGSQRHAQCVVTPRLSETALETRIPLMHPEGALYWVHEEDLRLCAYTTIPFL